MGSLCFPGWTARTDIRFPRQIGAKTSSRGRTKFGWMALMESRRGSRIALAYFGAGQLVAVLVTAGFLFFASMLAWPWAIELAGMLDVGPSGGTMACLAACVSLLGSPWRQRAWIAVFGFAVISVLFLGTIADLEHAVAIIGVLAVQRSLRVKFGCSIYHPMRCRPVDRVWNICCRRCLLAMC